MDVVLTTHVDDFLWACTESGHALVDRLLTMFEVGRKEDGRLRFCGKQFDASGHDILLDVADNTRKTTYVEIAKHRNPADPVTTGEEKQLRSVVGSLSWIARQARPDILYRVSKRQSWRAIEFEPYWPSCMGTELPAQTGRTPTEEQSRM